MFTGAFWFGLVIGYITYRTLRRTNTTGLSDIAAVIGAVGGGAILKLFPADSEKFEQYATGLAVGFFAYLILSLIIQWKKAGADLEFLGDKPSP